MKTFYWYDYETFGADPARDRPAQFAGLRTDENLHPVGNPRVLYCRPTPDYLPNPDACLITGITPQIALERGVTEVEFMAAIDEEFSRPETCVVGYNNIRFDDEVTRYGYYRNLMDPYGREWRHGNSRWDLIDVARMARALRPEGIEWPRDDEGRSTFRLDRLTVANGIDHGNAHDALSDVRATMDFARLLRGKQPRLYQYLLTHRGKQPSANLLALGSMRPVLHVSSRFPAERGCLAVIVALARHPGNPNGVITFDLSVDPSALIELSVERLHERVFTAKSDLPEGVERVPLKTVHLNKCPALAPVNTLQPRDAERWGLDLSRCREHLAMLGSVADLPKKVCEIVGMGITKDPTRDVDLRLYDGFIGDDDRRVLEEFRRLTPERMARTRPSFKDERLPELVFRFRARNFPQTLGDAESRKWREFCWARRRDKQLGASLTCDEFERRLDELELTELSSPQRQILRDLRAYGRRQDL
jgi:exodeoxyribonuclease-1